MKEFRWFVVMTVFTYTTTVAFGSEILIDKISADSSYIAYGFEELQSVMTQRPFFAQIRGAINSESKLNCAFEYYKVISASFEMKKTKEQEDIFKKNLYNFIVEYSADSILLDQVKNIRLEQASTGWQTYILPLRLALFYSIRLNYSDEQMLNIARVMNNFSNKKVKDFIKLEFLNFFKKYAPERKDLLKKIQEILSDSITPSHKNEEKTIIRQAKPLQNPLVVENTKGKAASESAPSPDKKIRMAPQKEITDNRSFSRPEERGEDFSGFSSEKLLDKLEKGDKIEQRKAANVLWDKYGTNSEKLSDEGKEKIGKAVDRYLIMTKTDFEEGFLQLQRLWHLAIPALLKNVTNTDEAVSEKSAELITLMKTEKIIRKLVEDSDKAETEADIKKYIFALEFLHINNPSFMEKRTRLADEECNVLYKELVVPQIKKLNARLKQK